MGGHHGTLEGEGEGGGGGGFGRGTGGDAGGWVVRFQFDVAASQALVWNTVCHGRMQGMNDVVLDLLQ